MRPLVLAVLHDHVPVPPTAVLSHDGDVGGLERVPVGSHVGKQGFRAVSSRNGSAVDRQILARAVEAIAVVLELVEGDHGGRRVVSHVISEIALTLLDAQSELAVAQDEHVVGVIVVLGILLESKVHVVVKHLVGDRVPSKLALNDQPPILHLGVDDVVENLRVRDERHVEPAIVASLNKHEHVHICKK